MTKQSPISEASMQRMEANIPELAGNALKLARLVALTAGGKVMEARAGQLIETTADGTERVIRSIAKPTEVRAGEKRVRSRRA